VDRHANAVLASDRRVAALVFASAAALRGQVVAAGLALGWHAVRLAAIRRAALEPLASVVGDRDGLGEATVAGVDHRHERPPFTSAQVMLRVARRLALLARAIGQTDRPQSRAMKVAIMSAATTGFT